MSETSQRKKHITGLWQNARRRLIIIGLAGAPIVSEAGDNWLLWGAICLILLAIAGILLLILRLRRPKERPKAVHEPTRTTSPLPTAYLEHVKAPGDARLLDLKSTATTIGRGESNDLVISQDFPNWETVSRHHARIYRQDIDWIIEDNNSSNGIYVNGKRTGRNLLQDGWQIDIGGVTFTFRIDERRTGP